MAEEFKLVSYLKGVLKESGTIRRRKKAEGINVPMFLAANITEHRNQQGTDSYLMRMHSDTYINQREDRYLDAADWDDVFFDAEQLGIRVIFICGGEPLTRRCILERAARYPAILFPVITNGTMMDDQYLDFFRKSRNLVPILNMDAQPGIDVSRDGRGSFMYAQMIQSMEELHSRGLLFGTMDILTRDNYRRLLSQAYLNELRRKGSSIVLYRVFTGEDHPGLGLDEPELRMAEALLREIQSGCEDMVVTLAPGSPAAFRGSFFQKGGLFEISPWGGVQPAPCRTDGGRNVMESSLAEILKDDIYTVGAQANIQ